MSETWYAAFGLLALLCVANAVMLVAVMRQVGVLHQRVPPIGPGSVGPDPGTIFPNLSLESVPGIAMDGFGSTRMTLLAYVRPDCGLCERIPGFLETYAQSASAEERELISYALATDAPESDAARYWEHLGTGLPLVRHPDVKDHYQLTGSPYILALADRGDGEQLLLAGGIVNALEQLEDLVELALENFANAANERDDDGARPRDETQHTRFDDRLDVIGR